MRDRLADGLPASYSFYTLSRNYSKLFKKTANARQSLGQDLERDVSPARVGASPEASNDGTTLRHTTIGKIVVPMSQSIIINLDPQHKSDRAETAFLHFDISHNTSNGFHFQLNWLGTSRLVEDILMFWQRSAEKYGLKLM